MSESVFLIAKFRLQARPRSPQNITFNGKFGSVADARKPGVPSVDPLSTTQTEHSISAGTVSAESEFSRPGRCSALFRVQIIIVAVVVMRLPWIGVETAAAGLKKNLTRRKRITRTRDGNHATSSACLMTSGRSRTVNEAQLWTATNSEVRQSAGLFERVQARLSLLSCVLASVSDINENAAFDRIQALFPFVVF